MQIFKQSEGTAARRYAYLHLVDATDGITPETGEAGGQPQISKNGAAFGNTSATLTAIGNGAYYVALTAGELDTLGFILVRFKSVQTAEFQALGMVVAYDPYAAANLGLTNLDATISSRADPGDQMALTAAEETAIQAKILSDATPFPGADVPAIKAKTDLIPADIATQLDTNIPAIKTKTDQLTFTLANKVDASIQAAGDFAQAAADKVWASASRTLTSFGTLVADIWSYVTRSLTDKADFLISGIKTKLDDLNDLSLAQVEGSTILAKEATLAAVKAQTDNLPSDPADESLLEAAIGTRAAQATADAIKAQTDNLPPDPASESGALAKQATVLLLPAAVDVQLSGSHGAGSWEEVPGGDPWSTLLPGAYPDGSAGKILGGNLDAKVSEVKAKTDLIPSDIGDIPTDDELNAEHGSGSWQKVVEYKV